MYLESAPSRLPPAVATSVVGMGLLTVNTIFVMLLFAVGSLVLPVVLMLAVI